MSLKIYRKLSVEPDSAYVLADTLPDNATTYQATGLAPSTNYTFKVQKEGAGTWNPVTVTTQTLATNTGPVNQVLPYTLSFTLRS